MDYKLFKSINQLSGRCTPIDFLMIFLSKKVRYVFAFVMIFMWFRKTSDKKAVYCAGISSGITLLINKVIKLFYYRPRPFIKHRVGILIPSKVDSSFPSKHTLLVFAISTSIFLQERLLGSIMWILSLLTGFSRIWVGHHYLTDIISSALIGSITSVMVNKAFSFCKLFSINFQKYIK
ncbi:undecaprenyl-diphosphatase [Schinkia azotoformans]|uniref:PAP2 family protein n=1 Tax=Schinkia azotoformans LMG 9581 TaxID=1131731 RepID=K6CRY7_SCHAZ|nr:undecaprenyl-diphosphatase [Schinkia azotoformans]EKN62987.1 PAP2 family protein [Schinkia azotoformans LMG 9581]MEC1639279.1 undecaprenyl-diphosphatase [Schinkia azotoformans]MEC1945866.1 undecaprenyl-diphosphatase [Schinkia azotoformans]MED4351217.1 undecaprenyl-diphosphatase [Schinkia azotoformans]